MNRPIKLSERETKCLEVLGLNNGYVLYFKSVATEAGLEEKQVRRSVRSLARKGLAKHTKGLFDDDGMVAGSGYEITDEGMDFANNLKLFL